MSGQSIDVVLTFDDFYWAPAFAVMRSIALSSRRPGDLRFHLIHIGLTPPHRLELDAIGTEFRARIIHIALENQPAYQQFVADLPIAKPFSPVIYARLLIDALLQEDVERLVYLDCDTLVRAPIELLAETDLGGKSIGAVLDAHRHMQMLGTDLRQNGDVFDFGFSYFNSGVLLIDRAAFARANVPERTKQFSADGLLSRLQYDQAALNLIFKGDWLPLDFRWNLINPETAHEALEPRIVHYTGPRKPWGLLPGAAYGRLYRHVMTNRLFYDFRRAHRMRALRSLVGLK